MRFRALAAFTVFALAACDRAEEHAEPAPAPAPRVEVAVSDELPGLTAPATGIAFWDHPALSFNSMMIIANADGAIAYNIEDGTEVARIDGVDAGGAAVSYIGIGAQAAGVLALHDQAANSFQFHGVDNASRAFLPIEGETPASGTVQGFCFGRAEGATGPSLFVLRSGAISIFNYGAGPDGLMLLNESEMDALGNLAACAIDRSGLLIVATDDGFVYRLDRPEAYANPLAHAPVTQTGGLAILNAAHEGEEEGSSSVIGQILLFDEADGAIHVFDSENGRALGVVAATGASQIDGVSSGSVMGATSANLGALYRSGLVAFGVEAEGEAGPVVRVMPYNGVLNALSLPEVEAISPRGKLLETEDRNILIPTDFTPQ